MADAIYDPLAINLLRQTRLLIQKLPQNLPHVDELSSATSERDLLAILSRLLTRPELTEPIAKAFRPILMDLCARWVEADDCTDDQLFAIAFLVEVQEELYPVLDRMLRKPRFRNGPLESIAAVDMSTIHSSLVAYFRIQQANREIPDMFLWPLMPLSRVIWSEEADNGAKLLAIRCYAMQSGMGEAEREGLERQVLQGEPFVPDCPLEYGRKSDGEKWVVDGWMLPVIERDRIQNWRNDTLDAVSREGYYVWDDGDVERRVDERNLSPLVANVQGVLLLRSALPMVESASVTLVPAPSSTTTLRSLATHISLRLPVLLTSAPSAGKSLFLAHLACILHPRTSNQLITIHLADTSLDPHALLGSYASSPTSPGSFEWKEGVLVRAMREGRWVIFEDVDKASSEVLGTIRPLIESMRPGRWIGQRTELDIPGRGTVVAADAFRVFATRSVKVSQQQLSVPAPTFLGAHKFWEVIVESPTTEELKMILDAKFPKLKGETAWSLVNLWEKVRELGAGPGGREVGVRELEKLCTRVESLLPAKFHYASRMDVDDGDGRRQMQSLPLSTIFTNPSLKEDIFTEARDVFFGAGALTASARAHAEAVVTTVGSLLEFDSERQAWLISGRVPPFAEDTDANGRVVAVSAGYTRLAVKSSSSTRSEMDDLTHSLTGLKRPFAMHKPAIILLSRIARAVALSEPILLTGETGTGKTSAVTHLAGLLRRKLVSLNLSHQTESGDLLGGFKPVDARVPGSALMERWAELFGGTFSRKKNEKFEGEVRKAMREGRWSRVVGLWRESGRLATERIKKKDGKSDEAGETPRKRRRVEQNVEGLKVSEEMWTGFLRDVDNFEVQHIQAKGKFAFDFVEGPLVKALRSGDWVLLDEVNLASPETLECITGLLHGPTASITLTEQGSLEPVPRHPDFRLFACMNPATDVGKKDLPPNIRARFTEIDVPPPDADKETLLSIIKQYIGNSAVGDKASIMDVAEFYQSVKALAEQRQIADGANHRPHYSMRTLTRALTFANDIAGAYGFPLRRALWEGCLMAFTMVLDRGSARAVTALAHQHVMAGVKNPKSLLTKDPGVPRGRSAEEYIKFGPFYLEKGPYPEDPMDEYIITPSVEGKLIDLARIVLTRRFPVLIEGPTSSGKTSAVEYLAKRTGHRFVRINNHEHTDIQEYLGSYVSDPLNGKLIFKDGLLVRALRNGDWIVLDELNLAPTDVLEALNRLLDDNRELVVPETQEVVKPHPHFMLFATQNPPGLYAGRKVLSRAFRNRFLEVHFEDVPQAELETILCQRCRIAPSYGKTIVAVFRELQQRRQTGRVFESKHGFATLRDLFRWAGRDAVGYQELAENGYMLIGERARREDDRAVVKEVIENVMGVRIDEKTVYNINNPNIMDMSTYLGCTMPSTDSTGVVWTNAMQRLFILVSRALRFNEPVLLVGETGSGKTSVCQVYADAVKQMLIGLNCHQNTETADLIGGLRPVRNKSAAQTEAVKEISKLLEGIGFGGGELGFDELAATLDEALKSPDLDGALKAKFHVAQNKLLRLQSIFEWHDGPLVEAMRNGDVFLLDEISLADDSVLERLNSVLEPSRTIVLAEKGGEDSERAAIKAAESFKLVATMNPGGDYGKKELSPALRNRFTEVWVPPVEDREDLELIVSSLWKIDSLKIYTNPLLDFTEWLCSQVGDRSLANLRDLLAWVTFTNSACQYENMPTTEIFHHAAHMTFLDGLSSLPQLASYSKDAIQRLKADAEAKLEELVPLDHKTLIPIPEQEDSSKYSRIGPFAIPKGEKLTNDHMFNLQAPTTRDNALRIVRACQVAKPILLEGSPGVGKTSLVTALANVAGHQLCRINLSDQTDIIDLFGSDLPVEGGGPGEFAWRDAEFLKAMQEGHWVLLDEMNLAPQAILEGLNAVLDHRGAVYIPELNRSFSRHPSFRIFAAQNPLTQGGGRKGLPKSFVNRFTKVYVEELSPNDLSIICGQLFPELHEDLVRSMITFNMRLNDEVCRKRTFARQGSPWEFNLRDVIRWGFLLRTPGPPKHPVDHLRSVYLHRFRTEEDRRQACALFDQTFGMNSEQLKDRPPWTVSSQHIQIGYYVSPRQNLAPKKRAPRILKKDLAVLESIGLCVSQCWLTILTGQPNCGKTEVVRLLAHFTGNVLREISANSATDTMDILGSFEQVDGGGRVIAFAEEILALLDFELRSWEKSRFKHLQEYRQALSILLAAPQAATSDLLQLCLRIVQEVEDSSMRQLLLAQLDGLAAKCGVAGRFEWVDGPLVQAMKNGYWLLLDNANMCNPSVLDRLNSLCEPNGFLTLSERGIVGEAVQVIKPHPNFRLFMTVDSQYGELSRAMRNRGIEIGVVDYPAGDDPALLMDHLRSPASASPGYWKACCLQFDETRRGSRVQLVKPLSGVPSSGRLLDQDSALAYTIDQAPTIIRNVPADAKSCLHFFARTMVPRYMHACRRGDTSLNIDVYGFQEFAMSDAFTSLRKAFTVSRVVSSDIVPYQPMDFFLVNPSSLEKSFGESDTIAHHAFLQLLDFVVSAFLHEKNTKEVAKLSKEGSLRKSTETRIFATINALLESILDASEVLLKSINTTDLVAQTNVFEAMTKVMSYGIHLRKTLENSPLDHSTLLALARSILDAVSAESQYLVALQRHAHAFNDIVSLTSGLGLFDVWSSLYAEDSPYFVKESLTRLDELATTLSNDVDCANLRRRTFEYLTLATLPTGGDPNSTALVGLGRELDLLLQGRGQGCDTGSCADSTSVIVELDLLSLQAADARLKESKLDTAREVVSLAIAMSNSPLQRLAVYRQIIWYIEAGRDILPLTARMHLQWLHHAWELKFDDESGDPSALLQPALLRNTFGLIDWKERPLSSLPDYEKQIEYQAQMTILQCEIDKNRPLQLTSFLYQSLCLITQCFDKSLPDERADQNYSGTVSLSDIWGYIIDLVSSMEQAKHGALAQAAKSYARPVIDSILQEPLEVTLGKFWTAIGLMLFELIVPSAPIDPAAVQNITSEHLNENAQNLAIQIALHQALEEVSTGNSSNKVLQSLRMQLERVESWLSKEPRYPVRKDLSRLHMYWSEIMQFRSHVLARDKLFNLTSMLEQGADGGTSQEQVVQQSIAGFYQRLDSAYADFVDINVPLKLSMLYLRFGLRLTARATRQTTMPSMDNYSSALSTYPCLIDPSVLGLKVDSTFPTVPAIQHVTLRLALFAFEKSIGIDLAPRIDDVEVSCQQALRLWRIDRAKEQDQNEATNSLYRRATTYNEVSDADIEKQEFLALFPSFEDVLSQDASMVSNSYKTSSKHVQVEDVTRIAETHVGLFGSLGISNADVFHLTRMVFLERLLQTQALPANLDDESLPLQLSMLSNGLSRLRQSSGVPERYNFYFDSYTFEAKKALETVQVLRSRLTSLIHDWPEQMVLQHLRSKCDIFLRLGFSSPLAKLLSALEQLLLHMQDWEMYANKENSLKSHQRSLTNIIIDWRRLELSSWRVLLESQEKAYASESSTWWFRLYEVCISGALGICEQGNEEQPGSLSKFLADLIPLLDDYIISSSLGQFHARLQLLETFKCYLAILKKSRPEYERIALTRVHCIMNATVRRFSLHSSKLANSLREQKAVLEKEIQEFIKLASWKDINVHALKASAQRTHHQLFKVVRKFREILKQCVRDKISPELAGDMEAKSLEDPNARSYPRLGQPMPFSDEPDVGLKSHLSRLGQTFTKYDNLIDTRIRRFILATSPHTADELATEIIITSQELSNVSIPTNDATAKREGQQKALLVRKRKAWSTLLKELKRMGISANPKPSVLQNLADECWLREQPILVDDDEKKLSTDRIEVYFLRLQEMMPRLHSSLSNHHPDISTRELQRGIMLFRSSFSLAIDLRHRLAEAIEKYNKLLRSYQRLRGLIERPKIMTSGSNIIQRLCSIQNILCRLSCALQEVSQGIRIFNQLKPLSIPEALLQDVDMITGQTNKRRDELVRLLQAVQLSPHAILLEDEYESSMMACRQISHVQNSLRRWSLEQPKINHLVRPVLAWITSQDTSPPSMLSPSQSTEDAADSLINSLLVVVQSMLPNCPEELEASLGDNDQYILQQYQNVCDLTYLLELDTIYARVDSLIANLASKSEGLEKALLRAMPFIEVYLGVAYDQISRHCQWTKTLFKLSYVTGSVIQSLSDKGFCKPPEAGDAKDDADADTDELADGVGLGEAAGLRNASKEIEDESQVEGLKGEEGADHERDGSNEDKEAIEMSQDIGGEMEDVPEGSAKDEDSGSEDESETGPEERLGKLDASDPSAVDEKLWGSETGPDNSEQTDDKTNEDHGKDAGESEVVAKEGKHKEKKNEKEAKEENVPEANDEEAQMEEEMETQGEDEPNASGAPMDQYIPEANTLDLPDDMNLEDLEMKPPNGEQEEVEDEIPEGVSEADPMEDIDYQNTVEDEQLGDEGQAGDEMTEQHGQEADGDDSTGKEDAIAQADISAGQGGAESAQSTMGANQEQQPSCAPESSTLGEPGEQAADILEEDKKERMTDEPKEYQQQPAASSTPGAAAAGPRQDQGQANAESESQAEINPLRSLGDAIKEIRQRFDEILSGEKRDVQKQTSDVSTAPQVEYLQPDDTDYEMQALGPAGEEQAAKLDDLHLVDDDMPGADVNQMDVDVASQEQHNEASQPTQPLSTIIPDARTLKDDIEGAVMHDPDLGRKQPAIGFDHSLPKATSEMEGERQSVEMQLVEWQSLGFPEETGEHIWRQYESLTHDLAYALCEQLRLVLEPTLATRLKGDYRTGKRLNMKKIIPYIASDYTKDKIWLRRTRPSQREYQVLIAIDDSRSMAESHSIHLAFQTLALVAKALNRLESGDVAIASFGEAVRMLHSFEDGQFTDQAGTKVISAFRFNQKATNVLALVETSLKVLESARDRRSMGSATAGDLWQLEIIISDGLCQDHDRLRALLRKAEEQRVMFVFIIVDSLHSSSRSTTQNSILHMDKAEYKLVDGRMELQLQKYLNTFPFEYYVVLRNVEALPEVLAGTLKQFFERISES